MISDWLKVLLNDAYMVSGADQYGKNRIYYSRQLRDLKSRGIDSVSAKDIIKNIKASERFKLLKKYLAGIDRDYLYGSETHGLPHNERVALFSFYLADKLKLNDDDLKIALYAAFYHDIGRENDEKDPVHGQKSAEKLKRLGLDLNDEEMKILQTIVMSHSLDDLLFRGVMRVQGVSDTKRCETLFKILKDADGLDRVRLEEYPVVMPKLLRNKESREMILASYQLFDNYETINKVLSEEKDL